LVNYFQKISSTKLIKSS